MAAGVQVDEGWVESNAPAEETFPAELEGHAESLPGRAEVNEVEGLIPRMIGPGDGPGDDGVVTRSAVTGSDPAEGNSKALADFIGGPEGRNEFFPEMRWRERVFHVPYYPAMRIDDFLRGEMAQFETQEKLHVAFLVLERTEERRRGGGRGGQVGFRGLWRISQKCRFPACEGQDRGIRLPGNVKELVDGKPRGGCSESQRGAGPEELPSLQDRARGIHLCVRLNSRGVRATKVLRKP